MKIVLLFFGNSKVELFKVFYNEKPDVIHIHSTISGVAVRILKLFGVVKSRIIYQPHGWSYIRDDGAATHIYKILESFLSLATDAFVVISKFEYEISVVPKKKLFLIPNGISDLSGSIKTSINSNRNILFVGRFDKAKGVDVLIKEFVAKKRGYTLNVVGDFVLNDIYVPMIKRDCLVYHGWVDRDKLFKLYQESWAVIIPSRWDGFNLVAIESMSFSRAVFASDVGGLKYLINSECGELFELNKIGETLDKLALYSKDELATMGRNGREIFLREYKITRVAKSLHRLYEELCS